MKPITEQGFNRFIAAGQWSSSFFIASAFLMWLTGVEIPKEVSTWAMIIICLTAPLFLTIGMYQCWKLPDNRRLVVIPAIVVLLGSGALMFSAVVEQERDRKTQVLLTAVHESAKWLTAKAEFDAALASYTTLTERKFDQEYAKRFDQNEAKKSEQWVKLEAKSKALTALEPMAPTEAKTAFDLFGKDWAWLVATVFVALYELSNHSIALALTYRAKGSAPKIASNDSGETQSKRNKPPVFGVDDYVNEAEKLGDRGRLAGYRQVAESTGQSAYLCRGLFAEAVDQGKIERITGERGARRKEA